MPHCGMQDNAGKQNSDADKSSGKMPSCPICQGLHFLNNGFVPPSIIAFVPRIYLNGATALPVDEDLVQSWDASSVWPRGPPIFA